MTNIKYAKFQFNWTVGLRDILWYIYVPPGESGIQISTINEKCDI